LVWNDPVIGINWPLHLLSAAPLLAVKDINGQSWMSYIENQGV